MSAQLGLSKVVFPLEISPAIEKAIAMRWSWNVFIKDPLRVEDPLIMKPSSNCSTWAPMLLRLKQMASIRSHSLNRSYFAP